MQTQEQMKEQLTTLKEQAAEVDKKISDLPPWVIKLINQRVALARSIEFYTEATRIQ